MYLFEKGNSHPFKHLISAFFLTLGLGHLLPATAATSPELPAAYHDNSDEQAALWKVIDQTHADVKQLLKSGADNSAIGLLLASECPGIAAPEKMKVAALLAEADALEDDKGFDLRGGYTTGSESSGLDDDDGETYLELNWNVLRGGYQSKKDKAIALRNQAEAMRLAGELEHFKRLSQCRGLAITNSFANLRSALLKVKLELMTPVHKIERRAYFKGWSFLDDLLDSESDIRNVRKALQRINLPELMDRGEVLKGNYNLPVIDIDLASVIRAIQSDDRSTRIRNAKRMAAQYGAKVKDQKNSLRFFVRQEFSHEDGGFDDDGVAAGVRFIVPLSKTPGTTLDYEIKGIDDEHELESWRRVSRVRAAYVELHEHLERLNEQQYRYLRAVERLRRSVVGKSLSWDVNDLATAVIRARSLVDASLELVKAKEELYQRVNEVLYQARLDYDPTFIKVSALPDEVYRARAGHRSLYIWSGTFNEYSNDMLWQFIESKSIRRVILSAGHKTDQKKLNEFASQAGSRDIDIGLIVGGNEWVQKQNRAQALTRSVITAERTGHLHLDVEPHTLPDYKVNRRAYIDAYIELIAEVRKKMYPGDKLSISVPVHWDQQDYARLNKLVDTIFIMSYETPEFAKLARRLAPIMEVVDVARATIALRPQDFADEWELEQTITKLIRRFGATHFALHDAKTYMAIPVSDQ